jgi:hypothetical protein
MKQKRLRGKYPHNYLLTGIAGLVLSSSYSTFDEAYAPVKQKSVERKHISEKNSFKERKNLLKVVHNPETQTVRVAVKDLAGKTVDFYVFGIDGTMIINYKLKSREKKLITNLEKGSYTYNAFAGDEEIDFGKIVIE